MRKTLLALPVLALVAAAGWTGLWFYGKGRIVQEIEAQAALIRARGDEAAYDAVEIGGFPLGYTGRIVAPRASVTRARIDPATGDPATGDPATGEAATARYTWSAPWIEARARVTAPDTLHLLVADTQEVVLDLPELGGTPLPIALTSTDLRITTTREGDEIVFEGGADTLGGSAARQTAQDGTIDATYAMRGIALSGRTAPDRARGGPPRLSLAYAVAGTQGRMVFGGTAERPGGTVEYGSGASEGTVDSTGPETGGTATLADLAATVTFPQLGGEPLAIGIGRIEMATRLPSEAATEPQPFAYRLAVEDVTLADMLWMLVDPASAFAREIDTLVVDLEGRAVFPAAPSNAEAFAKAMESGMPVRLDSLRLTELAVDALGVQARASGESAMENGVPRATATLSVDGFGTLMNGLVKNGRIPPQQAMVVQLMVESFGRTEDDTIRFDFETRDGMMYVNDIPVGEAPAMPQ